MVKLGLVAVLLVLLSHLVQGGHRFSGTCPPGKELRKNGQQEWKCERCKDDSFSLGGFEPRCKQCRTCTIQKEMLEKEECMSLADCIRLWPEHKEVRKECRSQMKVVTQILSMKSVKCHRKGMKKKHCMRKMMKKLLQYEHYSARSTVVSASTSRLPPPPPNISTSTATLVETAAAAIAATTGTTATVTSTVTSTVVSSYSTLTLSGYNEANYEEQVSRTQPPQHEKTIYIYLAAGLVVLLVIPALVIVIKRCHVKHQTVNNMNLVDIPASDHCQVSETSTSPQECTDDERQLTLARDLPNSMSKQYDPERQWENWAHSLPLNGPCPQAATMRQSSSECVLRYPVYGSCRETLACPIEDIPDIDGCLISEPNLSLSEYPENRSDQSVQGPENTPKISQPAGVGPSSVQTFPDQTVRPQVPGTGIDEYTSRDTLLQSDISQTSSETEDEDFSADTDSHSGDGSVHVTLPAESCLPNTNTSNNSSIPPTRLDNFTNNFHYQKHLNVRPENVYGNLFTSKGTQTKYNHENTRTIFGYEWNKSADFTSMGGHLTVPKSDITLEVPRDAVPRGESVCVQAFVSSEFHNLQPFMDDDEVIVSPVGEFQMSCKRNWDRHVKIHIPCVKRNPKETFRVRFFQKNTSGNVEFGDVPLKEDGLNQELYYVKKEDHVEIFTVHFTGFFCSVCGHTCPLDLLALVFGCYGHHGNEAWITLVVGDRRNSIPEVRQKLIDKEKALNGGELVAERPIRLVEEYDCQSRLMFTLHVRSQAQLWRNADTHSGDQQVRRLRELIRCSCSKLPNVTPSEFESHHTCEDNLQWVYSCDDPSPDTFSCKILVEHLLNGDVVTPRHDACNEGVTSIVVPPVKLKRPQHLEQMKRQDGLPPMGFGELTSSKKPLFSHDTNFSSTSPLL